MAEPLANTWKDIAVGFLKVGATAYGGPAIMGIMQAEFQERRPGTSRPHVLEGGAGAAGRVLLRPSSLHRDAGSHDRLRGARRESDPARRPVWPRPCGAGHLLRRARPPREVGAAVEHARPHA